MPYLDVSQSLTEKYWVGPDHAVDLAAQALMQNSNFPMAMCSVLARLGIGPDEIEGYLDPLIKKLLPDPRKLLDMPKAAERILRAVSNENHIAIFADYDVDGASSAALLLTWLKDMGQTATLYVPDRIDEGYGPNEYAMRQLSETHDLIICVDCGTLSHDAIAAVKHADVLVLDHHLAAETLPDCVAVVNPNRQDETGALSHLCAAAVVFLCLVECGRLLREQDKGSPNLIGSLDLVALATVADVAPLVGVNRAFVHQGLKVMARRARPGLVALSDIAKMQSAPKPYHLGFLLGPRINAGGRVGQSDLGARLLIAEDPLEAEALATRLDAFNAERRKIEEDVHLQALAQAEARGFDIPLVWAAGEGWHPGVVGIVASRLREATGRPAVVIGIENGEGRGSGRSVNGIDLGAAVQNLAAQGVLIKGGGHKMAAGLTVAEHAIETAMTQLGLLIKRQGLEEKSRVSLRIDTILMPSAATTELVEILEKAGPFGAAAPAPRFAFADVVITFAKQVGKNHLKLRFSDGLGKHIDAIAFNKFDTSLGQTIMQHDGRRFHLVGQLELNEWQGQCAVQLRLEDAALAATN